MHIRLGPVVAASVLAVSLAAPVRAQTTEEWYRVNAPPDPSIVVNNLNVGPYGAQDLGPGTNPQPAASGPAVDLYCVDFLHEASYNPFDAYVTPIAGNLDATGPSGGPVSYKGNAGKTQYLEAAWLASQFFQTPTSDWYAIHLAIWNIMDPGAAGLPITPDATNWMTLAGQNYQTVDANSWAVVHSFDPREYQEFLINTTPEPVSSTLLLGGLLGVGAGWLRRRRQQQSEA